MENASKALLIAAAILIAVLLVAVGMAVLNSTDVSSDLDTHVSSQEINSHNAKVKQYIGKNKSGNVLRQLVITVNEINKTSTQHDIIIDTKLDKVITGAAATVVTKQTQKTGNDYSLGDKFAENARYTIKAVYEDATGYIIGITVE